MEEKTVTMDHQVPRPDEPLSEWLHDLSLEATLLTSNLGRGYGVLDSLDIFPVDC